MLEELGSQVDMQRVHFMGLIDYRAYLSLLQISTVHVYLTYPFVLSWSFVEALACGCLVVGSSTPPVLEVLRDGKNGLTVDFFSHKELAEQIESALEQPEKMQRLRAAARATAVEQFDLKSVLLPRWLKLFDDLIKGRRPPCRWISQVPDPRSDGRLSAFQLRFNSLYLGGSLAESGAHGTLVELQRRFRVSRNTPAELEKLREGNHRRGMTGVTGHSIPVRDLTPFCICGCGLCLH